MANAGRGSAVQPQAIKQPDVTTTTKHERPLNEAALFDCFDVLSITGKSNINSRDAVQIALSRFNPKISASDVRWLLNHGHSVNPEKLNSIIFKHSGPKLEDVTGCADFQSFALLDPNATGSLSLSDVTALLLQLPNVGELDEEDKALIQKLVGCDEDHKISQQQWSQLGNFGIPKEVISTAHRKRMAAIAESQGVSFQQRGN